MTAGKFDWFKSENSTYKWLKQGGQMKTKVTPKGMEHTPTPWEVGEAIRSTSFIDRSTGKKSSVPCTHTVYINIRGAEGQRIAALSVYGKLLDATQKYRMELGEKRPIPNLTDEEADANAEFIVRAVNAHEELVEAAKNALKEFRNDFALGSQKQALIDLQAAIAKAEAQ